MKYVILLGLALAAYVSTVAGDCHGGCDDDFSGFGTEPGKCGCCPWPCCCKCFEEEDCITTTTKECECIDILFIIDASGSIGTKDWAETLFFANTVATDVSAGNEDRCGANVYVSVITFGNNATLHFNLLPVSNIDIMGIEQVKRLTNIVEGMELGINAVWTPRAADPDYDCKAWTVIMTDGRANFRQDEIASMGAALRSAVDDMVVCIGVTSKFNATELAKICPNADMQFSVLQFDNLVELFSISDMMMGGGGGIECYTKEECFCCCTPEQYWGGRYGSY